MVHVLTFLYPHTTHAGISSDITNLVHEVDNRYSDDENIDNIFQNHTYSLIEETYDNNPEKKDIINYYIEYSNGERIPYAIIEPVKTI